MNNEKIPRNTGDRSGGDFQTEWHVAVKQYLFSMQNVVAMGHGFQKESGSFVEKIFELCLRRV